MDADAEDEGLFEWVNIRPEISGLPFIVWISEKGGARHDVRVKISPGPRAREFAATVSVRPQVEILAGELSPRDLQLVRDWIDLNRETIIRHWNGDILYTDEALAALQALPPRGYVVWKLDWRQIQNATRRADQAVFKFMVLTVLFFGALSPVFRDDATAKYAGVFCVVVLTVLAALRIYGWKNNK